jgi:hypothetical protein
VGILQERTAKNAAIGAKHQKRYFSSGLVDRAVLQTAAAARGRVKGTTAPHCSPRNFANARGLNSLAEPNRSLPWNLIEAQSCCEFHHVTGLKTMSARTAAR